MKFIIFFLYIPLVYSEIHRFFTTYTGMNEQAIAGIPEFIAVTTLDDQQIDYYDNIIKKLIPKQDWMEEFTSTEMWKEDTEIREDVHQIYKINIPVIMERFNQSDGVHTYQRIYGCDYDDKTGYSQGFDRYIYDGKEFISLDVRELRYTAHVAQASLTVKKWNKDRERFTVLKRYYNYECVYWLKHFLALKKAGFKRRETNWALVMSVISLVISVLTFLVNGTVFIKMKKWSGFKQVSCSEEQIVIDKSL